MKSVPNMLNSSTQTFFMTHLFYTDTKKVLRQIAKNPYFKQKIAKFWKADKRVFPACSSDLSVDLAAPVVKLSLLDLLKVIFSFQVFSNARIKA